ncbi:MAG: aldo/keto reductase [Burkholderiaceae bacterium]
MSSASTCSTRQTCIRPERPNISPASCGASCATRRDRDCVPVDLEFKGGNATAPKPPERPNMSGLSPKRIFTAVDASLQRLGIDTIDLYQIHRFDSATPIEETIEGRRRTSRTPVLGHL